MSEKEAVMFSEDSNKEVASEHKEHSDVNSLEYVRDIKAEKRVL